MDQSFSVGKWVVDPRLNRIRGADGTVDVEPRLIRILQTLASRPGALVTRDELMSIVWPDVIVSESSLTSSVSELRRLLADDASTPTYIETIRGRGYRLVADVAKLQPDLEIDSRSNVVEGRTPVGTSTTKTWVLVAGLCLVAVSVAVFLTRGWNTNSAGPRFETLTPLTSMKGAELGPVFSPDSRQVVFVHLDLQQSSVSLFVQNVDAATAVQLTDLPGSVLYPSWSPDGSTIAFVWHQPNSSGLYSLPRTGGLPIRIADLPESARHLTWIGEDKFLFSATLSGTTQALFLLNVEDDSRVQVTNPVDGEADLWPLTTTDSRYVVFQRLSSEDTGDLFRVELADPQTPTRLSTLDAPMRGHGFSADGRKVHYAVEVDRKTEIRSVGLDGRNDRLEESFARNDLAHFRLAPDGSAAAFVRWNTDANLFAVDQTSAASSIWINSSSVDKQMHFAPDGKQAVFVSERTGNSEIWKADVASEQLVPLTDLRNPSVQRPRWSPDGRSITFEMRTDGQADVYVLDADGGVPRRITESQSNDESPTWSGDARHIYFASDRTGSFEVWRYDVDTGSLDQVTTQGGYRAVEHPDGNTLTISTTGSTALYDFDLKSGEWVQATDSLIGQTLDNFEVDDRGIHYVNRNGFSAQFSIFLRPHPGDAVGESDRATALAATSTPTGPIKVVNLPAGESTGYYSAGLTLLPGGGYGVGVMERAESDLLIARDGGE